MPKPKHSDVSITKIESFDHYLEIINTYDFNSHFGESILLFRGQKESAWDLLPGIARVKNHNNIEELEQEVLKEFKRRAISFLPNAFNTGSEWEWLALAQHFKLPTRLLDWTENALTALYFAFEAAKDSDGNRAVWVFGAKKNELVDTSTSLNPFAQSNKSLCS